MTGKDKKIYSIFSSKTSTGTGTTFDVSQFKNLALELATSGTATLTIKIQGSLAKAAPDFSTAASKTNPWTYVAVYNTENPTSIIPGSTGIGFVGTDAVYNLLVNTDGLNYINATITAYTAGSLNLNLFATDNE